MLKLFSSSNSYMIKTKPANTTALRERNKSDAQFFCSQDFKNKQYKLTTSKGRLYFQKKQKYVGGNTEFKIPFLKEKLK